MKTSVIGYADIGSQTGQALTYLGRELDRNGALECVYPRGIEKSVDYCVSLPIPGGRIIPRGFTGVGRIFDRFHDRGASEKLFDYCAARTLKRDAADVHLFYQPGMVRSVKRSVASKSTVVVRGPTEFLSIAERRIKADADSSGVDFEIDRIQRRRWREREKTLREADHVIALSEFVRNSYIEAGISPRKISVVPLGIDASDYPTRSSRDGEPFTAIYVGSINFVKGIRYLLTAWDNLGWQDAELKLCGRVSNQLIPVLNEAPDTVRALGHVEPRDHLPNADVFVFPSLSEGFAKAPLEAMASGLPVIVTTHSGVNDIITDGEEGFVVPPNDAVAIADRLTYLRNHSEERERMGEAALRTAKEYSWERHGKAVIDVLENVQKG